MPQLDTITFFNTNCLVYLSSIFIYTLKFLKNVIGYYDRRIKPYVNIIYIKPVCNGYVHVFHNKEIKKQLVSYFKKHTTLFSKLALVKYLNNFPILNTINKN